MWTTILGKLVSLKITEMVIFVKVIFGACVTKTRKSSARDHSISELSPTAPSKGPIQPNLLVKMHYCIIAHWSLSQRDFSFINVSSKLTPYFQSRDDNPFCIYNLLQFETTVFYDFSSLPEQRTVFLVEVSWPVCWLLLPAHRAE